MYRNLTKFKTKQNSIRWYCKQDTTNFKGEKNTRKKKNFGNKLSFAIEFQISNSIIFPNFSFKEIFRNHPSCKQEWPTFLVNNLGKINQSNRRSARLAAPRKLRKLSPVGVARTKKTSDDKLCGKTTRKLEKLIKIRALGRRWPKHLRLVFANYPVTLMVSNIHNVTGGPEGS